MVPIPYSAAPAPSDFMISGIDWLCEPESPLNISVDSPDSPMQKLPIPSDLGEAWVEILELGPGFSLINSKAIFNLEQPRMRLPSASIRSDVSESTMTLTVERKGRIFVKSIVNGPDIPLDPEVSGFFRNPAGHIVGEMTFDTSTPCETSSMWISDSMLRMLIGEEYARKLMVALHLCPAPAERAWSIPTYISHTLHTCAFSSMSGDLRRLLAYAKTTEYLCLLAKFIIDEVADANTLSPQTKRKMRQLHEELTSFNGSIPRLNELAERYGRSMRSLNRDFKVMYGQTIGAFMAEQRLTQSHTALLETDIPMKVLSARLGYSHVTHFIAAFKRKFGYTPGSLRREQSCG